MQRLILLIMVLMFSVPVTAQDEACAAEVLEIYVPAGINMREQPDVESGRLGTTISHNTFVEQTKKDIMGNVWYYAFYHGERHSQAAWVSAGLVQEVQRHAPLVEVGDHWELSSALRAGDGMGISQDATGITLNAGKLFNVGFDAQSGEFSLCGEAVTGFSQPTAFAQPNLVVNYEFYRYEDEIETGITHDGQEIAAELIQQLAEKTSEHLGEDGFAMEALVFDHASLDANLLTLRVNHGFIHDEYRFSPGYIFWRQGESPQIIPTPASTKSTFYLDPLIMPIYEYDWGWLVIAYDETDRPRILSQVDAIDATSDQVVVRAYAVNVSGDHRTILSQSDDREWILFKDGLLNTATWAFKLIPRVDSAALLPGGSVLYIPHNTWELYLLGN